MTRGILISILLASASLGANDWSGDANCVAVYNFETATAMTDTINANNLTDAGTDDDQVNYMQGTASRGFVSTNPDDAYRADASLSAGFPCKNGNADDKFSVCAWIRGTGWPTGTDAHIIAGKWITGNLGWTVRCYTGATTAVARLSIATGAATAEHLAHATELHTNDWYHVTFTFDDASHTGKVRVIDANLAAVGSEASSTTFSAWYHGTDRFTVGSTGDNYAAGSWQGNIDELVIFNDVITAAESAQIAAGTYGAAATSSDRPRKAVIARRRHQQ